MVTDTTPSTAPARLPMPPRINIASEMKVMSSQKTSTEIVPR